MFQPNGLFLHVDGSGKPGAALAAASPAFCPHRRTASRVDPDQGQRRGPRASPPRASTTSRARAVAMGEKPKAGKPETDELETAKPEVVKPLVDAPDAAKPETAIEKK